MLRALEARLGGRPVDLPALCERVAAATADLLDRRSAWLPEVSAALDGPDGVFVLAPVERLASAEQGALIIREGPRRPAVACETGDWSHVDVYLAKTLDYRALLFAGSRWDGNALEWLAKRGSTVVAVGGERAGRPDDRPVLGRRRPGDRSVHRGPRPGADRRELVVDGLNARWHSAP